MFSYLVAVGGLLMSTGVCESDYVSDCDSAETCTACIERYYACGMFAEAISAMGTGALSPEEKYLRGASYFALYARTQPQTMRCEYLHLAVEDLTQYLTAWQSATGSSSGETSLDLSQRHASFLYHAANMVVAAGRERDCPGRALTRTQIQTFANAQAQESIDGFFAGTLGSSGTFAIEATRISQELRDATSAIVAAVASTDNQLRLGAVEAESLQRHLDAMELALTELTALESGQSAVWLKWNNASGTEHVFVEGVVQETATVLGGVSAAQFEDGRNAFVARAENLEIATDVLVALTDNVLAHTAIGPLEQQADENVASSISRTMSSIQEAWESYRPGLCETAPPWLSLPWWCQ